MLHPVAQLSQHDFGNIQGILGDKVNAYTFGTDEPDDLLDLGSQGLRQIGKQQMSFIEKENQFGLFRVADFRQVLEESDDIQSRNVA